MVHKTDIIPGLSRFIDTNILSHYAPTSLKRIIAAGAVALYLKQNTAIVDTIISNPLFSGLGVVNQDGMINLDILRDVYKEEIRKAGFLRINFPMLGEVDFTVDDVDALYNSITSVSPPIPNIPIPNSTTTPNIGAV